MFMRSPERYLPPAGRKRNSVVRFYAWQGLQAFDIAPNCPRFLLGEQVH
jgi:hypothetical protein